jgi:hypothetical protein
MILLGVGEYGATCQKGEIIKTLGLGSCVAVLCHDPAAGIVGMVHVALPESSVAQVKPVPKPGYYADTGLPALFESLARVGSIPTGPSTSESGTCSPSSASSGAWATVPSPRTWGATIAAPYPSPPIPASSPSLRRAASP